MKKAIIYLALSILFVPNILGAGNYKIDSLKTLVSKVSDDTSKVTLLNLIASELIDIAPDSALTYVDLAFDLAEAKGSDLKIAECYNITGNIFRAQDEYRKALELHTEVLEMYEALDKPLGWVRIEIGKDYYALNSFDTARAFFNRSIAEFENNMDADGHGVGLNNLGMVDLVLGNDLEALKLFVKSTEIFEKLDRLDGMAWSYELMAGVYYQQRDGDKALEYLLKSKKIYGKRRDLRGLMSVYLKLGPIYVWMGSQAEALDNYKLAMQFAEEIGDDKSAAVANNRIGDVYAEKLELEKALRYQKKALAIQEKIRDKVEMSVTLNSIGGIFVKQLNSSSAIDFLEQSIALAEEIGYKFMMNQSYSLLAEAHSLNDDYKSAYKYQLLHTETHDQLFDEKRMQKIQELQARYEDKKDEEAIVLLTKENRIQELKANTDGIVKYGLLVGFLLLGIVMFLILNRNKIKQKAMAELEEMNEKMEGTIQHRTKELQEQKKGLEASRNSMAILSVIGRELTSTLDFETIYGKLHERISEMMKAECFGVRIYHPETNVIDYKYEIENGVRGEPMDISMDDIDNYSVWCVVNKKEIFINDNLKEFREYTKKIVVPGGETPHSLLFSPMMKDGKVVGVITVQSFERNAYSKYHADILKTLASYTAIALENAGAFAKLERRMNTSTAN
ncbi:MAG: tetratricopeptide repeat protein [Flavobacteriales bacterium]|nr:tetratricopeptide repeat protein [Flavobacteriales bacterium]